MSLHPHLRRAAPRVAVAVGALCLAVAWMAPLASAHAVLESTDPANDTVLASGPAGVTLTFDEPVQAAPDGIRVFGPSGDEVAVGRVQARDTSVVASLRRADATGTYTVSWQVVSADGHVIDGAFIFHVRRRTAATPRDLATGPPPMALPLRAAGTAVELGALVAVLALAWSRRRIQDLAPGDLTDHGAVADREPPGVGSDRRLWGAALCGALVAGAATAWSVDASPVESFRVLSRGATGWLLLVGVALTAAGLVVGRRRGAVAIAVAAVIAAASAGHPVALSPVWRSGALTLVHVGGAVVWAVGLLWLGWFADRAEARDVRREVRFFSPLGMTAAVLVAVSGGLLLVGRTGWDGLWESGYGRLGLAKVGLLAVALVLAARNRWTLEPGPRLARSVRAEVAVLAVALVAGTALGQMAPPPGGSGSGPFSDRRPFGDGQVQLLVDPGAVGANEFHVTAFDSNGTLMAGVQDLAVELRQPDRGVGPIRPEVTPIVPGHVVADASLTLTGDWTVTVTGHRGKFDDLRATFAVPIGR